MASSISMDDVGTDRKEATVISLGISLSLWNEESGNSYDFYEID